MGLFQIGQGTGKSTEEDLRRPRLDEWSSRLHRGGSGCQHIVDKQDSGTREGGSRFGPNRKCSLHVSPTPCRVQPDLGRPSAAAFQSVDQGHVDPVRDGLREQPRLVISARSRSAASGRNRYDDVGVRHQIARNRTSSHALTHEPRQGAPPAIFQAVNEGVRRRPQNNCEGGGRKLWAPSGAFDAGIGSDGA